MFQMQCGKLKDLLGLKSQLPSAAGRFMPPVEGQHMAEREPASSCNSNSGASDSRRESTSPRCSASLGNGEVTFRESGETPRAVPG